LIARSLDPNAWFHLFRERKGADIARKKGRTLDAVYLIKDTLDLEREDTAYNYIRRYAVQEMEKE
jgi:hypothetical protein